MELAISDLFGSDLTITSREIAEATNKQHKHVVNSLLKTMVERGLIKKPKKRGKK